MWQSHKCIYLLYSFEFNNAIRAYDKNYYILLIFKARSLKPSLTIFKNALGKDRRIE